MGRNKPWRIGLRFYDHPELPDATDPDCYACIEAQPQYRRAKLHVSLAHPNFEKEANLDNLIKHELGHTFTAEMVQWTTHVLEELVTDPAVRKAMVSHLLDLEDRCIEDWVTALEADEA